MTVLLGFLLLGLTRHRAFSVVTNPLFAVRDATLSNAICDGWRGLEQWRLRRYFVPSNSTKTTVFFVQPAEP